MSDTPYSSDFYNSQSLGSLSSARTVVPLVSRIIQPKSVLDVGCGIGTWLAAFSEHKVLDFRGIDGDYVDRSKLAIPPERFESKDLSKPFDLGRRFDLVCSCEVAEHLPAASAAGFVRSLVKHAPVVMFSAAVPDQGGTFHINEQWPEYWADLFAECGYVAIDCIRPQIWNDPAVEYFYAQNLFLFVEASVVEQNDFLKSERNKTTDGRLARVHPSIWRARSDPKNLTLGLLARTLPAQVGRSVRFRMKRILGGARSSSMLLPAKYR
ncbi:MAG: methyltransferase domain-containing protein [Burkholderiales bacterium]|nr:methyltransferase domain-containing protein [Phycisphaerae bacterium]